MRQYLTKEELKEVQMGILKYIDDLCRCHKIPYFVNYGTLIGAIRHKGMIPWDDDIDISMYREDYDRFIQAVKKDHNEQFCLLNHENSDWYFQNFLVVMDTRTGIEDHIKVEPHETSVFVDVFPVDRFDDMAVVEKTLLMQKLKLISYIKLPYVQYGDSKLKDICRKLMWYLLRPIKPRYFTLMTERLRKRYEKPDGAYEGAIGCSKDGIKEIVPKGTFEDLIEIPFEDMTVFAPKAYDRFLTQFYGDYMTPPTDEQIKEKSHQLSAYWRNVH